MFAACLDLMYPRYCAACRDDIHASNDLHVCWDCRSAIECISFPYCSRCGSPATGDVQNEYRCSHCSIYPPAFSKARSAAHFTTVLKEIIHQFKYKKAIWLIKDLGDLLEAVWRMHYSSSAFDALIAVPLSPVKERQRTYNQSQLLAEELSKRTRLPLANGILRRFRWTGTQTALTASERRRNVKNAFLVNNAFWVKGRSFLLIDDVMTTGATIDECSRTLLQSGAVSVCALTIARG